MNRKDAKEIAKKITNDELAEMFENAKNSIKDWTKVSKVNKSFTKGAAWNLLAKDFDPKKEYHNIAKVNMIREFGDYLPQKLKPTGKKKKSPQDPPIHQEPIF